MYHSLTLRSWLQGRKINANVQKDPREASQRELSDAFCLSSCLEVPRGASHLPLQPVIHCMHGELWQGIEQKALFKCEFLRCAWASPGAGSCTAAQRYATGPISWRLEVSTLRLDATFIRFEANLVHFFYLKVIRLTVNPSSVARTQEGTASEDEDYIPINGQLSRSTSSVACKRWCFLEDSSLKRWRSTWRSWKIGVSKGLEAFVHHFELRWDIEVREVEGLKMWTGGDRGR